MNSWLISDNKCFWPGKVNIRKLLVNKEGPADHWEKWDIRVLGSKGKFACIMNSHFKDSTNLLFEI